MGLVLWRMNRFEIAVRSVPDLAMAEPMFE
jgi:hypothetical protein